MWARGLWGPHVNECSTADDLHPCEKTREISSSHSCTPTCCFRLQFFLFSPPVSCSTVGVFMPIFFFFLIISHLFHATTPTIHSLEYPSGAPHAVVTTDMWAPPAEWSVGPPPSFPMGFSHLTCLNSDEVSREEREEVAVFIVFVLIFLSCFPLP